MRNSAPTIVLPSHANGLDHAIGQIDLIGEDGEIVTTWRIRNSKCTIGSAAGCSIQLDSAEVQPLHATLVFGKKHTLLRSQGATLISNRPVREWLIDEATEIVIGNARLVVHPTIGLPATLVTSNRLVDQAARLCKDPTPVVTQRTSESKLASPSPIEAAATLAAEQAAAAIAAEQAAAIAAEQAAAIAAEQAAAMKLEKIETLLQSLHSSLEQIQCTLGTDPKRQNVSIVESVSKEIDEFGKRLFSNLNEQLRTQSGAQKELISTLSEQFVDRLGAFDDQLNNHTGVQQMLISNLADQVTDRFGAIDEQLNRFNDSNGQQAAALQQLLAEARSEQQIIESRFQEMFLHRKELLDAVQVLRFEIESAHLAQKAAQNALMADPQFALQPAKTSVSDEQLASSLEIAQVQIQELNSQLRDLKEEHDATLRRIENLSENWNAANATEEADPVSTNADSQYETSQYETSLYETPRYETPSPVAPQYESPSYETPQYEATQYEATQYETTQYETLQYEAPQYEAPQYEAPQYEAPQYEAPQYEASQYEATQYEAPQYEAPQYEASQYEAPQYEAPQYEAPQYEAPQYEAPQYEAPQYEAPQYDAPQYEAPQYEPSQLDASEPEDETVGVSTRRELPDWFKRDEMNAWFTPPSDPSSNTAPDEIASAEQAAIQSHSGIDSISERLQRMLSDASSRRGAEARISEPFGAQPSQKPSTSRAIAASSELEEAVKPSEPFPSGLRHLLRENAQPSSQSGARDDFREANRYEAETAAPSANPNVSEYDFKPSDIEDRFDVDHEDHEEPMTRSEQMPPESSSNSVHSAVSRKSEQAATSTAFAEPGENEESGANEESEESIELYMQRLLSRVRGGSESEAAKQIIEAEKSLANTAIKESLPVKKGSRVAAAMGLDPADVEYTPPVDKLDEELFVPRQQPPEQRNDLAALRELANINARRAINRSDIRRTNSAFYVKLGVTALAVSSAVGIFLLNGLQLNAPFAGMISAIVVAILWGVDCMNHFRRLRSTSGLTSVTAAETAAGQSIRVGTMEDNGWRPTPA